MAPHDVVKCCKIVYRTRHIAERVEPRNKLENAGQIDRAVGRFERCNTTERGWTDQRAGGLVPKRERDHVPADRRFWICNGSIVLAGTLIGCNGTTTAFSNVWPSALHEILTLGMASRYDEAQDLQRRVSQIDAVMLPYRAAGVKAALNLLGFDGTRPRSPMPPMPPEQVQQLEQVMRASGLLAS